MFAPVTVYIHPKCTVSEHLLQILDNAGVEYDAVDVSKSEEARSYLANVLKLNPKETPITLTDTHDPIVGINMAISDLIDYYTASETGL